MSDYNVTVTVTIAITARNAEQAGERAERLAEWVKLDVPKSARWSGDFEVSADVEEV